MELKKCQCGEEVVIADVYCNLTQKYKGFAIFCGNCGERGKTFKAEAEAVTAWNYVHFD